MVLALTSGVLSILTLGPLLTMLLLLLVRLPLLVLLLVGRLGRWPPLVLTGPDVRLGLGARWTWAAGPGPRRVSLVRCCALRCEEDRLLPGEEVALFALVAFLVSDPVACADGVAGTV